MTDDPLVSNQEPGKQKPLSANEVVQALTNQCAHMTFRLNLMGFEAVACNAPPMVAQAMALAICKGHPFGAAFWFDGTNWQFIIASDDKGEDVGRIAKNWGGEGTTRLAGFQIPFADFLAAPPEVVKGGPDGLKAFEKSVNPEMP